MSARLLSVTVLLLITGCASVKEQTFNPNRTTVRTIAIADPVYAQELLLRYRNDQLETVDLISPIPVGRLFAYLAKENREAEFTELATTASTAMAEEFRQAAERELNALNFDIVSAALPVSLDVKRARNKLLKRIPAAAFNGADALLETTGEIGFTAAGRGKPFQSALWINVRLTQRDGTTLLQDRIVYNPSESNVPGVILYPATTYSFATQDVLLKSEEAVAALREATSIVAKELAFLLRGPVTYVR